MSNRGYRRVDPLSDPNYKGERTPKTLKDGPLEKRGCTDCFCLLLFGGFWFGLISIAIYGFTFGNPMALVAPYDSQGNSHRSISPDC